MDSEARDLPFCSDDELGYLASRTRFEAGQPLRLDAAYRLAHLPLVAPGHPDAIRTRKDTYYRDGRHPETFSLVMPLDGTALQGSDACIELERELRASPFAAKIAWPIVARRWNKLHATVCSSPGAASHLDRRQLDALARIGPVHVELRGVFSGNVNVGRLYLRVYPERRDGGHPLHQIQRALGRQPTGLFLIGLYNLTDHLDAGEAKALDALIERWWSRTLLRIEIKALWLLGATDDLVLDSRVVQVVPLTPSLKP
jgi:hypothetical protein